MQYIIKIQIMQNENPMDKQQSYFWTKYYLCQTILLNICFSSLSGLLSSLEPPHLFFPSTPCSESFLTMAFSSRYPHVIVEDIFLSRKVITQDVMQASVCSHLISSLNLHSASLYASYRTDCMETNLPPYRALRKQQGHL